MAFVAGRKRIGSVDSRELSSLKSRGELGGSGIIGAK
jgi:hypothetical protein